MVDLVVLSLEVSGDLSLPPIERVEHVVNLLWPLLHRPTLHIDTRQRHPFIHATVNCSIEIIIIIIFSRIYRHMYQAKHQNTVTLYAKVRDLVIKFNILSLTTRLAYMEIVGVLDIDTYILCSGHRTPVPWSPSSLSFESPQPRATIRPLSVHSRTRLD